MTRPQDAPLLAALETQHRELAVLLVRLQRARSDVLPPPATHWRGSARHAYDSALDALGLTMDAGIAAARSARDRTRLAISEVASRA